MILITGANGTLGRGTLAQLEKSQMPVRAMVRSEEKAASIKQSGVETVIADFADAESLERALQGVSKALLVSPHHPDKVALENRFIDVAQAVGNAHIVKISGLGTALDSQQRSGRWHAEIEQHLQTSGLPFTCLRPPYFMQNVLRLLNPISEDKSELLAPMADARIAMIDAWDISAVIAAILQNSEAHQGQAYTLTGPEALSMIDVAEQLSAATGKTIAYRPISLEDAKNRLQQAGMPDWLVAVVMDFWPVLRSGQAAEISDAVPSVTGRSATHFAEFAKRVAQDQ